eukprot:526283_1
MTPSATLTINDSNHCMAFKELIISGYIRQEVLSSVTHALHIPIVLTRFIAQTLFQKQQLTINRFSWGQYNSHWDRNDVYYLKPKYKNLKQELFKNKIFKLTTNEWRSLLRVSTTFSKSFLCHKMRAQHRPKWNILAKTPRGTNIKLKHIIALKLYSDYDRLISHFHTVLQGNNTDLKREIAHFTRLILEAVHLYGIHWNTDTNKDRSFKLYHAICNSDAHPLDTLSPLPYFPFNATSSMHVARTFATRTGNVWQLNPADTKGPIMLDLSLIGSYPEERMWLVMQDQLEVGAIHTHDSQQKLTKSEMEQMQFIEKLFNGSYLVDRNAQTLPNYERHMQICRDMLAGYVHSKLYEPSREEMSDMARMFELFMDHKRCVFVNGVQFFDEDSACGIYLKYHYKLVSVPSLEWVIHDSQYDALMDGNKRIESEVIEADISHVMPQDREDTMIRFKANCIVNEEGRFEFELEIVQKANDITYVEYEYEIYVPSLSCYYVCSHSNSHCTQYDILSMDMLRGHVGSLDMNIAIRILKCFDCQNQVFSTN